MQSIRTMKLNNNGADVDDYSAGQKWPRACDTCQSEACKVYCRADDAYLCSTCDSRIHAANHLASRHERVWVCDACESAPAAFLCKADAASLCSTCDATTHSANPLAGRHQRFPIMPISSCSLHERHPTKVDGGNVDFLAQGGEEEEEEEDEDEAASWLLLNPVKNISNQISYLFGDDVDKYLDLEDYNHGAKDEFSEDEPSQYHMQQKQQGTQKSYGGDSVVPTEGGESKEQLQQQQQQQGHNFLAGFGFDYPKADYSYNDSFTQSVSVSSMDVGIVPESTVVDVSLTQYPRATNQTVELFSSSPIQMPQQLNQMDREARVLRYREKKKTRKFEKTIRYASRKAYAETRPRIKGRFAKRATAAAKGEVDQMISTTFMAESRYGIVPSFI